jgi:hypothetical protein
MTDLIQRLRDAARERPPSAARMKLLREAADALERLRAELYCEEKQHQHAEEEADRLRDALERLLAALERRTARLNDMVRKTRKWKELAKDLDCETLEGAAERYHKERDRLRAALELLEKSPHIPPVERRIAREALGEKHD